MLTQHLKKLYDNSITSRVHIGEKIKLRAKEVRIGPTELGKMINTSKQNVFGIYKRKTVDTELLSNISKALDFDFFSYYAPHSNVSIVKEQAAHYKTKFNAALTNQNKNCKRN